MKKRKKVKKIKIKKKIKLLKKKEMYGLIYCRNVIATKTGRLNFQSLKKCSQSVFDSGRYNLDIFERD